MRRWQWSFDSNRGSELYMDAGYRAVVQHLSESNYNRNRDYDLYGDGHGRQWLQQYKYRNGYSKSAAGN